MSGMLPMLSGASVNCLAQNACSFGTQGSNLWSTMAPYAAAAIALLAALAAAWIAHSAEISEFREKWLDGLRRDTSDYIGAAEIWYRKWDEINDLPNTEKQVRERDEVYPIANAASVILWRIRLRINPRENQFRAQDEAFLDALGDLLNPGKVDPRNRQSSWHKMADEAVEKGREILKREWEVTKRLPIPFR